MWKDLLMWGLGTVTVIVMGVIGWFGKTVAGLLKDMLRELQKITGINVQHEERLKVLEDSRKDHEARIREVENKI